jgi:hypothetical protein
MPPSGKHAAEKANCGRKNSQPSCFATLKFGSNIGAQTALNSLRDLGSGNGKVIRLVDLKLYILARMF